MLVFRITIIILLTIKLHINGGSSNPALGNGNEVGHINVMMVTTRMMLQWKWALCLWYR